jgi:hypothetical protein
VPPVPELFDLAHDAGLAFEGRSRQAEVVSFGIWLVKLRDRLFALPGGGWVTAVRMPAGHGGLRRWKLCPKPTDATPADAEGLPHTPPGEGG